MGTSDPVCNRGLNGKKPPIGSRSEPIEAVFCTATARPQRGHPRKEKNTGSIRSSIKNRNQKKRSLRQRFRFIVHCSRTMNMGEKRTRNWSTIIYPRITEDDKTECPDNWAGILSEMGIKCAVSPLHDRDVYTEDKTDRETGDVLHRVGDLKKPHRHVIIAFDGVKTAAQAREVFERIGGVGAEPVNSLYGMVRYLTHEDNPEKAHYSTVDVLTFGGFEYRRYATTKEDEEKQVMSQMGEIFRDIEEHELYSFSDVADYLLQEKPELFSCYRKNAYFFANYLKSKQIIYRNIVDGMRE